MSETIIDRRSFTVAMAYAMLGGAAITLTACGGGSPTSSTMNYGPTSTPTSTPVGDKAGTISNNHGHSAVITAAQLTDGGGLVLDIQGKAPHSHTVTLSGDEVVSIRNGSTVTLVSSINDGGSQYGGQH